MRKILFLFVLYVGLFNNFVGSSAFGETLTGNSDIFYQLYNGWTEKDWQKWVNEEVYLLITKEQKEQLFATPLQYRWFRAQELWQFWGQASGLGEEKFFYIFQERLRLARESFGNTTDDRARILLLFGPAEQIVAVNSSSSKRTPSLGEIETLSCKYLGNLEIWIWGGIPRLSSLTFANYPVVVIFYKITMTTFKLWDPQIDSLLTLQKKGDYYSAEYESPQTGSLIDIARECVGGEDILKLVSVAQLWLEKSEVRPFFFHWFPKGTYGSQAEAYLSFSRFSPLPSPNEKEALEIKGVTFVFKGRPSSKTVEREVEARVVISFKNITPYSLTAEKEIVQVKTLWIIFKENEWIPWLLLETTQTYFSPFPNELTLSGDFKLTPGKYILKGKVIDSNSRAIGVFVEEFTVEPTLEVEQTASSTPASEEKNILQPVVSILSDVDGPYSIGLKKFVVLTPTTATKVEFFLDEDLVATVNRSPFEAEIDLGNIPRRRVVKAVVWEKEKVIAEVVKLINVGENRFLLRLEKPVIEKNLLTVKGQVFVPKGKKLEKIEVFVGDEKLKATLSPDSIKNNRFSVVIPKDEAEFFIRAVATLDDGTREEDVQFLLQEGFTSVTEVIGVELPVTVLGEDKRSLKGLGSNDFIVYEEVGGKTEKQTISAVQSGKDVPLNIGVLFDVSTSMTEVIKENQKLVIKFLHKAMKKDDRAFLVAFTEVPQLVVGLTSDVKKLEEAVIPLSPTGWTALRDALVTSMVQFSGLKGRKVLLVFTDGHDTASRIRFKELVNALRHSPVSIYFLTPKETNKKDRETLEEIAKITGGTVFTVEKAAKEELEKIEEEIRSGYVIAYTSTFSNAPSNKFRKVKVELATPHGKKFKIKTIDGYYPE